MPLHPTWDDLALRIACAVIAGLLIGFNRDMHGRPAGLRTMLLVSLAACFVMILANLLLASAGKAADGFVNMDVLRLPLGVLSGMGFLGAGAIVRRTDLVRGVTTAATMWIVTVIGLCFGAGQIGTGAVATVLTAVTLNALKRMERLIRRDRRATLTVQTVGDGPRRDEILAMIEAAGLSIAGESLTLDPPDRRRVTRLDVRWRSRLSDHAPPEFLSALAGRPGVAKVEWQPG